MFLADRAFCLLVRLVCGGCALKPYNTTVDCHAVFMLPFDGFLGRTRIEDLWFCIDHVTQLLVFRFSEGSTLGRYAVPADPARTASFARKPTIGFGLGRIAMTT